MPLVDENRLKGNFGAAAVVARLAAVCLVRPVAVDTDVGVDLYCETVAENRPFLHFWLQVKAGDQCNVDSEGQGASCRFSADALRYWSKQPVPVYAALVPTEWPVTKTEPDVFVVGVTTQILSLDLSSPQASYTLRSDYRWPTGDQAAVQSFLATEVSATTARLQIANGVLADIPTPTPQYVHAKPLGRILCFKGRILRQLRTTAAHSIILASMSGELSPGDHEFMRVLANIVEQFGEDLHWENFMARGLWLHHQSQYEAALKMYTKARDTINADNKVNKQLNWQELVQYIEEISERASRNEEI